MPSVCIAGLCKHFNPSAGLRPIALDVADGEHLVVVGPSGAGKTTLLRLIAGLETPDSGAIAFDGRDVTHAPPHVRHVALIAQRPALYPHLDVRHNLSIGVELRKPPFWRRERSATTVSTDDLNRRVNEAADWLGLTPLLSRSVADLSGGEAQRVVLGRAVVSRHPLWLLDEPLAHLDASNKRLIRAELLLLRDRLRPTMIEVTHDPLDALTLGGRVAVLSEGRLEQVGPPAEVYSRPQSRAVATSLGWPPMNFIDGSLAPGKTGAAESLRSERRFGKPVTLGVRPEGLALGPGELDLGEWHLLHVHPGGLAGLWRLAREGSTLMRWARPGELATSPVRLHAPPEACHWFDGDGQRMKETPTQG